MARYGFDDDNSGGQMFCQRPIGRQDVQGGIAAQWVDLHELGVALFQSIVAPKRFPLALSVQCHEVHAGPIHRRLQVEILDVQSNGMRTRGNRSEIVPTRYLRRGDEFGAREGAIRRVARWNAASRRQESDDQRPVRLVALLQTRRVIAVGVVAAAVR